MLLAARRWNFERFQQAVAQAISPIVIDRGNGLNVETRGYARFAVEHGYRVELKEPESECWQEILRLLSAVHEREPAVRQLSRDRDRRFVECDCLDASREYGA